MGNSFWKAIPRASIARIKARIPPVRGGRRKYSSKKTLSFLEYLTLGVQLRLQFIYKTYGKNGKNNSRQKTLLFITCLTFKAQFRPPALSIGNHLH